VKPAKFGDGIIAQEMTVEECVDDTSALLGMVKMFKAGQVGLMWTPMLFTGPSSPMPDALRETLVQLLRFHADRLEDRSIDKRMKDLLGGKSGDA
jgi:hypothetical protein